MDSPSSSINRTWDRADVFRATVSRDWPAMTVSSRRALERSQQKTNATRCEIEHRPDADRSARPGLRDRQTPRELHGNGRPSGKDHQSFNSATRVFAYAEAPTTVKLSA
jgi:hypothetical protein